MIELEGVDVVFGQTVALQGVEVQIEPGITGLFGPNASGKSTLLRLLAGLLEPTRGRVLLDGRPIDIRDESTRPLIGYAGHSSGLYPALTLEENLALFARLHGAPHDRVEQVIGELQLERARATPVGALSAGYKRRAAAGRALLHEPRILLLDEPYANVDDDAAELVSTAVRRWWEPGRTALIATHGAKKVKAYAGAGLILKRGRVVVHGRYMPREARAR